MGGHTSKFNNLYFSTFYLALLSLFRLLSFFFDSLRDTTTDDILLFGYFSDDYRLSKFRITTESVFISSSKLQLKKKCEIVVGFLEEIPVTESPTTVRYSSSKCDTALLSCGSILFVSTLSIDSNQPPSLSVFFHFPCSFMVLKCTLFTTTHR